MACSLWPAEGLSAEAEAKAATYTTFDPAGSTYTQPQAISPAGAITGYYNDANGTPHGFLRARNGTLTPFDLLGPWGPALPRYLPLRH